MRLNYLDKLFLLNFHLKPYFTPLKMKIPVHLKYKSHKGLSVMEVLISSLILLCLMGISSEIMYASFRVSREEEGLAFIRKEAVKGITWFIKDLRRSHGASLFFQSSPLPDIPVAISFLTSIKADSSGILPTEPTLDVASPYWRAYVIYYLKADPKNPATSTSTQKYMLMRVTTTPVTDASYYGEVFNANAAMAKQLKNADLLNILNGTTIPDSDRLIARNIYQVTITEEITPLPSYCTIEIETRYKSPKGGEIKAVETSTVVMKNTIMKGP